MKILCTTEWAFGRDRALLRSFETALSERPVRLHDLQTDPELNRTLVAFSGTRGDVAEGVLALAADAMDRANLERHVSPIPRLGALDLCAWTILDEGPFVEAQEALDVLAITFSARYLVPVFYQERSDPIRSEGFIPSLRRGGFGGLLDRRLEPNVGPVTAHPRLGVSVMGIGPARLTFTTEIQTSELDWGSNLVRKANRLRGQGDSRFLGVQTSSVSVGIQNSRRLFFDLTLPEITAADPIVEWLTAEANDQGVRFQTPRLLGAISQADRLGATRLSMDARQIIEEAWLHD